MPWLCPLFLPFVLCACEEGGALPEVRDGAGLPEVRDDNGQTGSPGGRECSTSSECRATAEAVADELGGASMFIRQFTGARCEQVSVVAGEHSASGPACMCETEGGGTISLGPAGAGCYARGRAGDCLFDDSEFSGCHEGGEEVCRALCEELEGRYAAEAARSFEASVAYSECVEYRCQSVLEVDGRCHPLSALGDGTSYDCALGGEAILAAHRADTGAGEEPPPCGAAGASASGEGGVCLEPPSGNMPAYFPRAEEEWQGMRIDLRVLPLCVESAWCGLARACVNGVCTGCTADEECAEGEICVLDHCVLSELAQCRGRSDCGPGQLCLLSGYTGGEPRGNEDMRAYCRGTSGGAPGSGGAH